MGAEQSFVLIVDARVSVPPLSEGPANVRRTELARHYGVSVGTIKNWSKRGRLPPPWPVPGRKHPRWRRDHFEALILTGEWPKEAWKGQGGRTP